MSTQDVERPQNRLERGDPVTLGFFGSFTSKGAQCSSAAFWSGWSGSDERRLLWLRRHEYATDPFGAGASDPFYRDLPEALKRILNVRVPDQHWLLVEIPKRLGFNAGGANSKVADHAALADAILDAISGESAGSPVRALGEALAGRTISGSSERDVWVDRRRAYNEQFSLKPPEFNPDLGQWDGDDSTWRLLNLSGTTDAQHKLSVPDRLGFPTDGTDEVVAGGDRLPTALTEAVKDEASGSPVRALAEALAGV